MITRLLSLDLSLLEKVRHIDGKIIARCPACAEHGDDRTGNHLAIFPSGKFACAATPGDTEHRRRIFAKAGVDSKQLSDPEELRLVRKNRAVEQRRITELEHLNATIRERREAIIARHPWDLADVWENSPQRIDCDLVEHDPRWFISSLFDQGSIVWTGEVYHSGKRHSDHWRSVHDWQEAPLDQVGPMTCPAIWKPKTFDRIGNNIIGSPYTVLDFDGFDGQKPKTPEEISELMHESLAIIRWIREGLHWNLAAMVWSGSKSIHAWFHTPPHTVIKSLKDTASALGIDAGLIGCPGHPCRLPGQIHKKTGSISRVLWLQAPTA